MNSKLLDCFKMDPQLYQGSSKAFWDDEHISKSMLAAHLDSDNDGASRKLSTIQKSVEWICECVQNVEGKRLLDLGCGPGIYAEMLCDRGFSVTGIDFSKRSIEYAQNRAKETKRNIEYRYQNYLDIDYENEYDVAILIYCDFGVLSPLDRGILLKKIHRALKTGGLLILDVFNENYLKSFSEMQTVEYEERGFWANEPYVLIQKNKVYRESNNTLEQYLIITQNDFDCFNIWNQIYSAESFRQEIEDGRFEVVDIFDNVCGKPFTGQEECICGVYKKI